MKTLWPISVCLAGILALPTSGCGHGGKGIVRGEATLDGEPISQGAVHFFPVAGDAPSAGGPIVDGAFSVEAPIGPMRVEITAPKVIGKRKAYNTPESPLVDVLAERVPARYNAQSELTFEVKPRTNRVRFDLTTP